MRGVSERSGGGGFTEVPGESRDTVEALAKYLDAQQSK